MSPPDQRPAFERGTGHLLSRLGAIASRSWAAFLAGHGLTQSQYTVLAVLAERTELGQQQLARSASVDERNLVAVLDAMVAKDLVRRRPDPADGRRRIVHLTPAGTALADRLAADAAEVRTDFLRPLDDAQQAQLNTLLQHLYEPHRPDDD